MMMTEQDNGNAEQNTPEETKTFLDGLRRVLMAGIGVAVLAQEEIEDFVTKLIDRGEIAESDGRSLVSDVLERRRREIQDRSKEASGTVDRRIEGMLGKLNVPTQSEIQSLSEQISELSKKVDELRELDEKE
jgi:poly(hydroxyalkanoate) granule-associated protein